MLKFRFSLRWLVGACLKRRLQITPNFCKPLTKRNTRRRCEIISWVDGLSGRVASMSEKTSVDTMRWQGLNCALPTIAFVLNSNPNSIMQYFSWKTSCIVSTWDIICGQLYAPSVLTLRKDVFGTMEYEILCVSVAICTLEKTNLYPTGNVATISGKSFP